MDTPAERLSRVLVGITIPLLFLTALALAEGRIELFECTGDACSSSSDKALILPFICIICMVGVIVLRISRDREYGDGPLDRWFSREPEKVMRERLENERFDSNDEGLGGRWAELEKKSLEARYDEEE